MLRKIFASKSAERHAHGTRMKPSTTTAVKVRSHLEKYSLIVSFGALAVITIASLSPRGSTGDPGAIGVPDSAAHVIAYAVAVLFRAATPSASLLSLILIVFGWSILIEVLQPLVGRSSNLHDILANALGVLLGAVIGYSLRVLLLRLSEPKI